MNLAVRIWGTVVQYEEWTSPHELRGGVHRSPVTATFAVLTARSGARLPLSGKSVRGRLIVAFRSIGDSVDYGFGFGDPQVSQKEHRMIPQGRLLKRTPQKRVVLTRLGQAGTVQGAVATCAASGHGLSADTRGRAGRYRSCTVPAKPGVATALPQEPSQSGTLPKERPVLLKEKALTLYRLNRSPSAC
jgi:hypothetical protein